MQRCPGIGDERIVRADRPSAQRQLDQHPLERRRERDQHLGVLVGPARRQADEDRRARRCRCPRPRRTTGTPQGRIGTSTTSSSRHLADGAGERQADRVALGDLERLEDDLVDAVALELERPGEDLVASAGIDRQPERELRP